jgi:dihydropteroate synthase
MWPLVASSRDLEAIRDQTPHVETSVADSVDSTAPPVVRALVQLSATLIMLVSAGEVGHALAVHHAIGKLLTSLEGSRTADRAVEEIAPESARLIAGAWVPRRAVEIGPGERAARHQPLWMPRG